jgi:hypothetical protein
MERVLLKTVHRLVHKPTLELCAAAAADDGDLVDVLAGLFDPAPSARGQAASGTGLLAGEPDTAARRRRPSLDAQGLHVRAVDQAGHERGVHRAHKLTM